MESSFGEEAREERVEVMGTLLAAWAVTPAVVEPGADASLRRLDDLLVLHLDAVEVAADDACERARVGDVRPEQHARARGAEGLHDVQRETPGIEIQHEVGEEPEVPGGDSLALIRMAGR